ncbi:hypothetical protein TIFTF001_050247 [Ficus carica]|uniref:Uncharacterized protein n=1 Tax=Ficus carica TaxID=3494 RepID=A0AA88CM51_FICCA|nr:hypothetical protein TIFTF001_050239 [Ficus carica]GMN22960.1 hypothetical protein TIFTF001_050241 [Ficus carica]GMN22973.1 hypothetical protein TIFTF001_050245 [Ficus carica]GMN22991.1 hypothetical protein TIFTF001_050247 [Ficus carica]
MEAPQSDGDISGVSATGTPILNSVWRVDRLQVHMRYRSNRLVPRVHGLASGDTRESGGELSAVLGRRHQSCAWYHVCGAGCPSQQRRSRILPNPSTWQTSVR